jgi:N-acetylmuramoyl-L-alanine amidase
MIIRLIAFVFLLSCNIFATNSWHYKCGNDFCVRLLFKNPLTSKSSVLSNPPRWFIDISKNQLINHIKPYKCSSKLCKSIRVSRLSRKRVRLVVDFDHDVKFNYKKRVIGKNVEYTWRFVKKPVVNDNSLANLRKKVALKKNIVLVKPEKVVVRKFVSKVPELRDIIVVVDPGHGGKDPGAIGYGGIKEKNIALAIAKKVVANLNKEFGFKAYLTRDKDVFLTLRQRINKARRLKADCFLAIHADAHSRSHARGMSVYSLSARGANREAMRWLSGREQQKFIGGVDVVSGPKILSKILMDFQQRATSDSSSLMGEYMISKLSNKFKMHKRSVGKAAFVVLKSPDIASLLLETGFVSNKTEVMKLSNDDYQNRLALVLLDSIKGFYLKKPIKNSLLVASKDAYFVTIKPKDTLYGLSKKHNISLSQLYLFNQHLKDNVLKVGDKVKIIKATI